MHPRPVQPPMGSLAFSHPRFRHGPQAHAGWWVMSAEGAPLEGPFLNRAQAVRHIAAAERAARPAPPERWGI
ncbi:hypothetical protein [Roseixanthobacter glucoisosaccharinicivorans]|uniref:hypothetical protein n=1 Tax=Roseixanthobacter glucoisosaccharinicivorans TaxID=3119923 RepID=UPI00372A07C3